MNTEGEPVLGEREGGQDHDPLSRLRIERTQLDDSVKFNDGIVT